MPTKWIEYYTKQKVETEHYIKNQYKFVKFNKQYWSEYTIHWDPLWDYLTLEDHHLPYHD